MIGIVVRLGLFSERFRWLIGLDRAFRPPPPSLHKPLLSKVRVSLVLPSVHQSHPAYINIRHTDGLDPSFDHESDDVCALQPAP